MIIEFQCFRLPGKYFIIDLQPLFHFSLLRKNEMVFKSKMKKITIVLLFYEWECLPFLITSYPKPILPRS